MNHNEENSELNGKGKSPFSLPDNYFGSFAERMMHKIELAEELKEFKVLSSLNKSLPFVTPENYFAQCSAVTETKVELNNYATLISIKKQNAFTTPDLYFEQSAKAIQNKIALAEELNLNPTLTSIEKQNVFTIPQNYFDNLSYAVREKIISEQNNVNSFGKVLHLVFSKKTAYALAAMLVLSLGLYYYNFNTKINTGDCNTLACLGKNEILNSSQIITMDEESLMKLVDPETLSKNLNNSADNDLKKEKENYAAENTDINDL